MRKLVTIALILSVVLTLGLLPATLVGAEPGPVAFWHFDEPSGASTVADSSGNGNTGIVHGATTGVPGKVHNALYFNGTNSWVDIPDLSITGDFSIGFWVNLDTPIGEVEHGERDEHNDCGLFKAGHREPEQGGDKAVEDDHLQGSWARYVKGGKGDGGNHFHGLDSP